MATEVTIEVDSEVWEALKAEAEPFVDTPNTVIRRKLGLGPPSDPVSAQGDGAQPHESPRRSRRRSSNGRVSVRKRAPRGSLLPEVEYELPILQVLHRHGGRVPAREVIEQVGEIIGDRLTPLDHEELEKGGKRWQKRVQFTRLRLVERGLIDKDSPRGVWEISDEGRRALTAGSTKV